MNNMIGLNRGMKNGNFSFSVGKSEVLCLTKRVIQLGGGVAVASFIIPGVSSHSNHNTGIDVVSQPLSVKEWLAIVVTVAFLLIIALMAVLRKFLRSEAKIIKKLSKEDDWFETFFLNIFNQGQNNLKPNKQKAGTWLKEISRIKQQLVDKFNSNKVQTDTLVTSKSENDDLNIIREKVKRPTEKSKKETIKSRVLENKAKAAPCGIDEKKQYDVHLSNNNKATWDMLFDIKTSKPAHLVIKGTDVVTLIKALVGAVRKNNNLHHIYFRDIDLGSFEIGHGKDGKGCLTSTYAQNVKEAIEKAVESEYIAKDKVAVK